MTKIRKKILLSDPTYFCNKSWTLSLSFVTNSWISFHSYLPNWYMGENNFFYSGKKSCCSDFDFEFVAGELVPNPSTTTSTTTYPIPPTTTSTTTIPVDCIILGGSIDMVECTLLGTGIITVPPPPPPCVRPGNMITDAFATGYTSIVPPAPPVDTTGSIGAACSGINFYNSTDPTTFTVQSMAIQYSSLTLGATIYLGTSAGCAVVPNGWYWTPQSTINGIIYHIESGILTEMNTCFLTTTTTTTACSLFLYDVEFYDCPTCALITTGTIGNSEALTIGKFYHDPVTGYKIKVILSKGCNGGTDRTILASSVKNNCPTVVCPTTTTTTTL